MAGAILQLTQFPEYAEEFATATEETEDGLLTHFCDWPTVLAMAVRDGATSVHYHHWKAAEGWDDSLWYMVGWVKYGLIPPTAEARELLLSSGWKLAAQGFWGRLRARMRGSAAGLVKAQSSSGETEWLVSAWGRGKYSGVDFHRLTPVPSQPDLPSI